MMKLAMSPPAAALLRSLLNRAGVDRSRILLTEFKSVDWQSLTFVGERHEIELRIPAPDAAAIAARLHAGLREEEFDLSGHVVADIQLARPPVEHRDGAITLEIEALTIAE
ncbi:hypothetical protein [Sphingomonas jaspsi]|uniref:hypothetical protein n=1 Tax=Sphingomonas jaspsi TaxID=392409 RepID=UPI0004BCCB40|nr:hypothetical protein [Sphingomonas jaspsi]